MKSIILTDYRPKIGGESFVTFLGQEPRAHKCATLELSFIITQFSTTISHSVGVCGMTNLFKYFSISNQSFIRPNVVKLVQS